MKARIKLKAKQAASGVRLTGVADGLGLALLLAASLACSQTHSTPSPSPSATEVATLAHHEITVAAMPAPYATRSAENPPEVLREPPAGARLHLPPGFEASTFAEGGFRMARWMALAPNGDVFVSDAGAGTILILRDARGEGKATERFTFASGLRQPFGMAFSSDYLYVANTNSAVRFRYKPGQTQAEGAPEQNLLFAGLRLPPALDSRCGLQS